MHDQTHDPTPVPSENPALRAFHGQQRGVRLDPLTKARRNPTSLRLAINAQCYEPHTPGSAIAQGHEELHCAHPAFRSASQAAVMAGSFSKKALHSAPYWLATTIGQLARWSATTIGLTPQHL
jgi:hypothetical protein